MRKLLLLLGLVGAAVLASPVQGQVVIPGYSPFSPYYNPYLWNTWNPYVNRTPSVVVENRPVFRNDTLIAEPEQKVEPKIVEPALPAIPLSAPVHVIRWTNVGRIPVLKLTIGVNGGPSSVTFEINGQPQTFRIGDTFTVEDISYRVASISIDGVSLVAQQSMTLR